MLNSSHSGGSREEDKGKRACLPDQTYHAVLTVKREAMGFRGIMTTHCVAFFQLPFQK
jgi:hypothetical protein